MIRLTLLAVVCLAPPDGPLETPGPEPSYEQMRASAGRDADAQVKLALWCEAHGMEGQKVKHLAMAVLADPSNAMARGLMGLVEYGGKWKRPEAVADAMRADVKHADLMAEYNGRRVRTPVKPDAQWKLALWCEEKGLKDESRAHLATVVRLDPSHAEAWKKLGYRKSGNRWVTEAEASRAKAEKEAQAAADRLWHARLVALRDRLGNKATRAEAERDLAAVADPRAVPMVGKVLLDPKGKHHATAAQVLGQIDAIEASRALATLALSDGSDDVRRRAIETLRRRDPREWADMPIGLVRPRIKYEVRPVGGPGSPGELYVEGKKANLKRIYSPADLPRLQPGDYYTTDNRGQLVLVRVSPFDTGEMRYTAWNSVRSTLVETGFAPPSPALNPYTASVMLDVRRLADMPVNPARTAADLDRALVHTPLAGKGKAVSQVLGPQLSESNWIDGQVAANYSASLSAWNNWAIRNTGRPLQGEFTSLRFEGNRLLSTPVGQLMADAQASAHVAAEQLRADVSALESLNEQIAGTNARAVALLSGATGLAFADDRKAWETWFVNQVGYAMMTPDDKPTVVENVPINYQPTAIASPSVEILRFTRHSCFGQGTLVRTLAGPRPIEALAVGDLVLTQDTKSGRLVYRPVTVVHHNPPSPTFVITAGDEPIVSSPFHRFWVAGRGWVMARDLRAGDPVRTLGGVLKVASIQSGTVQPVYNLDVEGDADFFAGASAALVHDNTLPDLKQRPFDAPQAVAAK